MGVRVREARAQEARSQVSDIGGPEARVVCAAGESRGRGCLGGPGMQTLRLEAG